MGWHGRYINHISMPGYSIRRYVWDNFTFQNPLTSVDIGDVHVNTTVELCALQKLLFFIRYVVSGFPVKTIAVGFHIRWYKVDKYKHWAHSVFVECGECLPRPHTVELVSQEVNWRAKVSSNHNTCRLSQHILSNHTKGLFRSLLIDS